ncbi:hypothetical protein OROGR_019240 [Orobanche gracilis]
MNQRLAASIYWFSAGTCRKSTRSIVSSRSVVTPLDLWRCKINLFWAQGFQCPSRHVHSFVIENDNFSELGPEVSEYCAKQIKLVTEKPDCVAKTYPSKRELKGRCVSSCTRPSTKDIVATMSSKSPTSKSKLGSHTHASTSAEKTKKNYIQSPRSVLVKNIISNVSLLELVEAVSEFGKVSGASFVATSNGLRCCNIEFEDVESSRRAVSTGKIAVGSKEFPVHLLDAVDIVAFRIENINEETTDYAIHSRCKTVGGFVGLARTSRDAVEVLFNVPNDMNHRNTLKMLNSTVVDGNHWSAHVVTTKSDKSEVVSSEDDEARYKLGMQILDQFSELRRQLCMKRIHLEDLECLDASIMHIEDLPPVR